MASLEEQFAVLKDQHGKILYIGKQILGNRKKTV